MSSTLAAPRPQSPHLARTSHPPAILGRFPNRRHVDNYKAQKRQETSRRFAVTKPSAPRQNEMRVFAHAVSQIMQQLKGDGLISKHNPKSVYNWFQAISELRYRRESRDSLGRTSHDGCVIFRPHSAP